MSLTGQPVSQKPPPPIRDKAHLDFVRGKPCLICGRKPSEAHHVRLSLRTMGKRVCDSKCVNLCAEHHRNLHSLGNEKLFWLPLPGGPLKHAAQLWHERTGEWPEWWDA